MREKRNAWEKRECTRNKRKCLRESGCMRDKRNVLDRKTIH